jgi:hypothetical protein
VRIPLCFFYLTFGRGSDFLVEDEGLEGFEIPWSPFFLSFDIYNPMAFVVMPVTIERDVSMVNSVFRS